MPVRAVCKPHSPDLKKRHIYVYINNVLTWCSAVITPQNNLNIKCFHSKETTNLKVVLGAHNISQREDSQQIIQVDKYIRHPNYDQNHRTYDIMLIKVLLVLKSGVSFFFYTKLLEVLTEWYVTVEDQSRAK